jgi:hypothetical protein
MPDEKYLINSRIVKECLKIFPIENCDVLRLSRDAWRVLRMGMIFRENVIGKPQVPATIP